MNPLSNKQLNQIGVSYVFNKLGPLTPYGKDAARAITPYGRGERGGLAEELDNVYLASSALYLASGLFAALPEFRDIRGSLKKIAPHSGRVLSALELFELKSFLLTLKEVCGSFTHFNASARLRNISLGPLTEALELLDPEGTHLRSFSVSEKYSEKLRDIREKKRRLELRINTREGDAAELERQRSKIVIEEENEELAVRTWLTSQLSEYAAGFDANIKNLAKLDLTLAKAVLSAEYNCCPPSISENNVQIKNFYSPEVKAALKEQSREVTPLSLALAPGTAVLTGANMGGKTVALKSLALTAYLFQCGFPVFAESAALPMFDSLDFIFEDEQSIYSGLSSFGAEMVHINGILGRAANGFSLVILDEPAKGTNPREGRAIASGLAAFLNKLPSVSILSTHYDNVADKKYNCYMSAGLKKELLEEADSLSPYAISELMDYRLVKNTQIDAVPTSNDAITICRLLKINGELLELVQKELD